MIWNFIKKRLQHRCFPVNIAKCLRTPILKNMYEKLLLTLTIIFYNISVWLKTENQKHPSSGVLRKRCSENMKQIYRKTLMPKCDFNKLLSNFIKITFRHGCSPVNLLLILGTLFPKNTSGRLLLKKWRGSKIFDYSWKLAILLPKKGLH